MGLAPGPDSPLAMTQSMPPRSIPESGPSSGSRERNFTRAFELVEAVEPFFRFNADAEPYAQGSDETCAKLADSFRALGEHLESMCVGRVHDGEDGFDES